MSRERETRAMLDRINVLERRASLLHAENIAAFGANRELFKRIQDLNSSLIASESLVERLLNGTEEDDESDEEYHDDDAFSEFDPQESRPQNFQAKGHPRAARPNANKRTTSIGSITSRLNRFEILLDEFCSEFEKSGDEFSHGQKYRPKGSPQFSIRLDPKGQSRRTRRTDNKARTLSPINVLRDIGQASSSPKPISRKTASNHLSPTIRSPTCLKLSLGSALDQGVTPPSFVSNKPRPARLPLERSRFQLDQRLLPLTPSSPSAPSLKSPTDYHYRNSVSSCDTPITPICLTKHRRNSSQFSFSVEGISEKEGHRQSPLSHAEKSPVEKTSTSVSPLLESVAATTPIHPPLSSVCARSRSPTQKYKFTSDEDFYRSPPPPHNLQPRIITPTGASTATARNVSDDFSHSLTQPFLRGRKSIPSLNRKTSTLSLLNGTCTSPSPASATSALDTDADIFAVCSSPSGRGKTMSDALKRTMKKYEIPDRVVHGEEETHDETWQTNTQPHFSLPIPQVPPDERCSSEERAEVLSGSSEGQSNQQRGIRLIYARLWHALWGPRSQPDSDQQTDSTGPTLECAENADMPTREAEQVTDSSCTAQNSERDLGCYTEQCAPYKVGEDMSIVDASSLVQRILTECDPTSTEADEESNTLQNNETLVDDVTTSPKDPNCADAAEIRESVAHRSLTKRASWIFSYSVPTTLSTDTDSQMTVTRRLSLTWMNIFKRPRTSEDYVSFPSFSTSQGIRGLRSMTNLDRANADSQSSWPSTATTIVGGGGSNRNSMIDELNAYYTSLYGTQYGNSRMSRNCKDAVYCTAVDADLLRDALNHHIFD
ncbi:hypothetical protein POJ06DRAFT_249027 [Lipomyces tetrasporus]|uniref:Uncharacterized protein n=1 Tax=Lipomyces tetrasporus TaxID=54092 RepID=A0AAD7QVP5_9ASCO|nr:uncharacterized protein POJ06DRAFT_249027 [Lipomyces tetrasporus]KAJ8102183.1 hypothetical protein POJ06DRAFT_249027 [Lipomyces tetrasporus]